MRELNLDEVKLVAGGYQPGADGPSNDLYDWALSAGNAGAAFTAIGTIGGTVSATALAYGQGFSNAAYLTGLIRGAALGTGFGAHFSAGVAIGMGVNAFNENVTGMSLGEAIHRTVN